MGDPLADAVVADFARLPPGRGRKLLDLALEKGIEAAAEAPPSLRTLFAHVDEVPSWVDWRSVELGGAPFRRTGALSALVTGCCALPVAYASAAGVKPLVFSGRLVNRAPRRLSQTVLFMSAVSAPGGLRRFAPGLGMAVRVRLIHAQVRRLLLRSGRWDRPAWGAPVNQTDMAGSNLLFSIVTVDALRRLGLRLTDAETEAVVHLWRYAGHIGGIRPELLTATADDARRLGAEIEAARLMPDEDSRLLIRALMETALPALILPDRRRPAPRRAALVTRFGYGLSASFLGRDKAEALGYPRSLWRLTAQPSLRGLIRPAEAVRRMVPGATTVLIRIATRLLQHSTRRALSGEPAAYDLPERLENAPPPSGPEEKPRDDL